MSDDQRNLDELIAIVRASSKYRAVDPALIRAIGADELGKRKRLKEAVKATKNKLHQVGGAYQPLEGAGYRHRWLAALQQAATSADPLELRAVCAKIMEAHASTRERIPILGQFYETILRSIQPVGSVIDIACGLNPCALPWMGLAADVRYEAYDIYQDMIEFINTFFSIVGVRGEAHLRDVIQSPPTQTADLALVLKTIPCLEQIDKDAGGRLLDALNVRHMLVSFPAQSLGGREKGMVAYYESRLLALVTGRPWTISRFEFATELAFLITK